MLFYRRAAFAILSATFAFSAVSASWADTWPTRPITMMVPFGPGSSSDIAGRILAARLSEVLGQQVIIENVSGGGSMTGTSRTAKAPPDGYNFVFASVDSMAIVPGTRKNPAYDSRTDFTPVGLVIEQPIVLAVRKDLPVNTLQEFIAHTKANQATMQFGSSGIGSGSHFSCARLNAAIGVNPTHVPYRSAAPGLQDLMAGRIDYFCALAAAAMGPVSNNSVRAISLLTAEPTPIFPDLRTAKEQGVAAVDSYFWTGFFLPKDTPAEIVAKLNDATNQTLNTPATIERLTKAGVTPIPADRRSPAYLKSFIGPEVDKWAEMIKAAGISLE